MSPWGPTDKDLRAMEIIFKSLPLILDFKVKNSSWGENPKNNRFPVISFEQGENFSSIEWWSDEKIVKTTDELDAKFYIEQPILEAAVKKLSSFAKNSSDTWEAYSILFTSRRIKKWSSILS